MSYGYDLITSKQYHEMRAGSWFIGPINSNNCDMRHSGAVAPTTYYLITASHETQMDSLMRGQWEQIKAKFCLPYEPSNLSSWTYQPETLEAIDNTAWLEDPECGESEGDSESEEYWEGQAAAGIPEATEPSGRDSWKCPHHNLLHSGPPALDFSDELWKTLDRPTPISELEHQE